jgi:CDP-glucose 4,6-dehydratase
MGRKNILITGISGFVGSNLALHELSRGNHVIGIIKDDNHKTRSDVLSKCSITRGDITDQGVVDHATGYYEVDVVYHLAANSIVKVGMADPVSNYRTNLMGSVNVLDSIRRVRPTAKVIVASSDKAYGNHDIMPYTEDMKLNPSCPYSTSKSCTDMISQSFSKTYGLNINTVRCSNIYGPGDMNTSRLIPNSILRILRGEKPMIYSGVANYRRELIYVTDVCEAYSLLAEQGISGEIYNIGIKKFSTIEEVVTMISNIMGIDGVDVVDKNFPEIPHQWMDGSKIASLGWKANTELYDGLVKSIGWYKERYDIEQNRSVWAKGQI